MNIEPLEARIAPASVTFADVDGDNVVITTSVGDPTGKATFANADDVRPEDHFGFVARQIGSFKAGAFLAPLTAATNPPIELSLFTADVTVCEV